MGVETEELRLPDEYSYDMESHDEVIVAAALKRYLNTLNRRTVKLVFGSALNDDPSYPQGYLTDLIDGAISDAMETFEEDQLISESMEVKAIYERCINRLDVIYGRDIVENMSGEFAKYVVDCYEAIPQGE